MGVGAGTVHLAYEGLGAIAFRSSGDGGRQWGAGQRISDPASGAVISLVRDPDIAVAPNGTVYVVYVNERLPTTLEVYITWSVDGGITWGDGIENQNDTRVDDGLGVAADHPTIAVTSGGVLVVAWRDNRAGNYDVRASSSMDGGATWTPSLRVNGDATTTAQEEPDAAAAGTQVDLVWRDRRSDGGDIMHARFSAGAWSPNHRVDDAPSGAGCAVTCIAWDPAVTSGVGGDPDAIAATWADDRRSLVLFGRKEIYSSTSMTGGATWGDGILNNNDVRVMNSDFSGPAQGETALVEAAGRFFVSWRHTPLGSLDDDVYASTSADNGSTWSVLARVNDDERGNGFNQSAPALVALGPEAVAAYGDTHEGDSDIAISWSSEGTTWGDGRTNDNDVIAAGWGTSVGGTQSTPQVVDYGTNLYAVWTDTRDDVTGSGAWHIYSSRSSDGGATWGDGVLNNLDTRVDDAGVAVWSRNPDLAVDPYGRLFVVYQANDSGVPTLYVTWSDDGGLTWGDGELNGNDITVDLAAWWMVDPAIIVDPNGTVFVIWADFRTLDADVYFSRSTDRGATWSPGARVNDDLGGATQRNPSVTANETGIYAGWEDFREGDWDIYFASSLDGGATWSANLPVEADVVPVADRQPSIAACTCGVLYLVSFTSNLSAVRAFESGDRGATWSAGVIVNEIALGPANGFPALAADSHAYAVWEDLRVAGGGNPDIFLEKDIDPLPGPWNGTNDPVNDVPSRPSVQGKPDLTLQADAVTVVWEDARLGARHIFSARALRQEPSTVTLDRVLLTPWPGPVVLNPGQRQGYTSIGINEDGSVNLTWTPLWSTTDSRGTTSVTGPFTADYLATGPVGSDNVTVTDLSAGVTNRSGVLVTGGPILTRIELSPWPGPVTGPPLSTLSFVATGYNFDNSLNTTWTPIWGTTDGRGSMLPTGPYAADYTAGTLAGPDNVTVDAAGVGNRTRIEIQPGPLSRVTLGPWPGPVGIPVLGSSGFISSGYDSFGNRNTTWTAVWGTTDGLGSLTTGGSADLGFTATYTAGTLIGADHITVADLMFPAIGNQSVVEVLSGPVARIALDPWPGPTTLAPTMTQTFTAWGYDAWGNLNRTWGPPAWSTTDGLGSLGPPGGDPLAGFTTVYTAGGVAGTDNVTAFSGLAVNQSLVWIVLPPSSDPLSRIDLTPWPSTTTAPTGTLNFLALGYSQSGLQNLTWNASWSTPGLRGTITAYGGDAGAGFTATYTAGTLSGADSITAANGTTSNTTAISVVPGPIARIQLTPWPSVTLEPAQSRTFTATAFDAWGNVVSTWTPQWNLSNGLGVITGIAGLTATFLAGTVPGTSAIAVSDGGLVSNLTTLRIVPGPLDRIEIDPWPGPARLTPASRLALVARGFDSFGNLNVSWTPLWGTTDARGSLLDTGGNASTGWTAEYTAGGVLGTDNVTVRDNLSPLISNSTAMEIFPGPLARIELTPYPDMRVPLGAVRTFTAEAYDAAGNRNTTWTPTWAVTNAIGTVGPDNGPSPGTHQAVFTATLLGAGSVEVTDSLSGIRNATTVTVEDAVDPSSAVNSLPPYSTSSTVLLTYTASDSGGSGLSNVTLFSRRDGGPWVEGETVLPFPPGPVVFTALLDGFYEFYSIARDNATNVEGSPPDPDANVTVDTAAPTVEISPARGAQGVLTNATIGLAFSEGMDRSSVEAGVAVSAGGRTVSGSWSWTGNLATFTPDEPFPTGTRVTVHVSAVAKDVAGNAIDVSEITFTTAGAANAANLTWLWLLLAVLLVLFLLVFFLWRRKRKADGASAEGAEEEPKTDGSAPKAPKPETRNGGGSPGNLGVKTREDGEARAD